MEAAMTYVDGFLIPIPTANLDAYQKMAETAGEVWMEYGALAFCETVAEDIESEHTKGFAEAAGIKPGETVVFSYIVYKSREHRDEVNKKVMADERIKAYMPDSSGGKMPFDHTRMAYGGFKSIVNK
jgi:uncharacterized protein YbaA (DUF1428 family)